MRAALCRLPGEFGPVRLRVGHPESGSRTLAVCYPGGVRAFSCRLLPTLGLLGLLDPWPSPAAPLRPRFVTAASLEFLLSTLS
jgi:hypothetical protein